MMTNLFSIFDPSSAFLSLNWLMLTPLAAILLTPKNKSNKMKTNINKIKKMIEKETSSMLGASKLNSSNSTLFSIFLAIAILNSSSLMPYNFTITSQISFNLPLAASFWLSYLILGWSKTPKTMLAHLVPMGTPNLLLPIMVMIELISQLIRPITLSVRLTANMVAGHLLMSLLGQFSLMTNTNMTLSTPLLLTLTFLEMCVSSIQAFVMMVLLTLYSTESN